MTERCWTVDNGVPKRAPRNAVLEPHDLIWVHLDGTLPETGRWLEAHCLDPIVVRALTAVETRPRTDVVEEGALINLRGPGERAKSSPDLLASVRLFVTRDKVFSVAMTDLPALAETESAVERGEVRDPGDLVCVLATAITQELDPDVAELGDRLDACEEDFEGYKALKRRQSIAKARSQAIGYRRFVAPQRVALERLASIEGDWLGIDDRQHLREAADRAARMAEELEAIRDRAALMHEQLSDLRAEQLDHRGLILSIAAMIFLPLTFVTGLFGMNVDGIPYAHHPSSFWVITGICLLIAVVVTAYFIVRRWTR